MEEVPAVPPCQTYSHSDAHVKISVTVLEESKVVDEEDDVDQQPCTLADTTDK